jgi:hypothetical protein
MSPEKVDSLADDVKPLVLELLRQISGLTARVNELVAQNKALLRCRISRDADVADLVLEGEAFDVGESIDRRLHGDPFDVGFNKVVLFQ